jgi:hypothetical protein
MLYEALDPAQRYLTCMHQKVCAIQKEYPTAGKLGKPQRQHWDIAVIKSPIEYAHNKRPFYDYFTLESIIEFGMNENKEHLEDDIMRVCHPDTNAEHKYIIHLYRLSEAGNQFSRRDWSSSSKQVLTVDDVKSMIPAGASVGIFYGMHNQTDKSRNGVWLIKDGVEPEKVTI